MKIELANSDNVCLHKHSNCRNIAWSVREFKINTI